MRAERAYFQCRNREFKIIDRTGRGSEVKNVIDFLFRQKNEIRNIMFDELEILVPGQVADVRCVAGD